MLIDIGVEALDLVVVHEMTYSGLKRGHYFKLRQAISIREQALPSNEYLNVIFANVLKQNVHLIA